jgi:hypothetical protein
MNQLAKDFLYFLTLMAAVAGFLLLLTVWVN